MTLEFFVNNINFCSEKYKISSFNNYVFITGNRYDDNKVKF